MPSASALLMIDMGPAFICVDRARVQALFVNVNQLLKLRDKAFVFVALSLIFVFQSDAQLKIPPGCAQLILSRTTFLRSKLFNQLKRGSGLFGGKCGRDCFGD